MDGPSGSSGQVPSLPRVPSLPGTPSPGQVLRAPSKLLLNTDIGIDRVEILLLRILQHLGCGEHPAAMA